MSQRRRNLRTQTDQELAELEAAEQQGTQNAASVQREEARPTGPLIQEVKTEAQPTQNQADEEEPGESRRHLVKHRAPRAENEEEQFDSVYKRDTYYIDRTYIPRLKKMIKKTQLTKTALMNEGLEMLFEKYGID